MEWIKDSLGNYKLTIDIYNFCLQKMGSLAGNPQKWNISISPLKICRTIEIQNNEDIKNKALDIIINSLYDSVTKLKLCYIWKKTGDQ